MPIHNRRQAMVRFIIEFGVRLEKHPNNGSFTESVTCTLLSLIYLYFYSNLTNIKQLVNNRLKCQQVVINFIKSV
jgi:hypothetical protein